MFFGNACYGTGMNFDKLRFVGIDNEDSKLKPFITVRCSTPCKYIAQAITLSLVQAKFVLMLKSKKKSADFQGKHI